MKIGITFFGSKLDLLCISKVLPIFCVFSKIRLKRKTPGDTWRTRRVPGEGGSRAGALGFSGNTWRIRGLPGIITRGLPEGLASLALVARGLLRKTPKKVPAKASKGALGRASGRLRKSFGTRGTLRRGLRKNIREGVFERGCEGGSSGGRCEGVFRRGFHRGGSGR